MPLTAAITLVLAIPSTAHSSRQHCPFARSALRFYHDSTHRWQRQMDARLSATGAAAKSPSCAYVRWSAHHWQRLARQAHQRYVAWFRSEYDKWKCIHSREGAWNDRGAPYMGGLQMDMRFQSQYGGEFVRAYGDAGEWPVWAQFVAAERAFHGYGGYSARGFGPWPTAC